MSEQGIHWGDLKEGDRVRCTREITGVVEKAPRMDTSIKSGSYWWFAVREDDGTVSEVYSDMHWTTEKLQDPEPQWVSGDVVRITALCPSNPYATFIRTEGRGWEGVGGNEADQLISNNWRQGTLDILHKADQQDIA